MRDRPHPLWDAAGLALVTRRVALFVDGGVALVEALNDAAELDRRHVRGRGTRRTGEGERVLRTRVGDVDHDDLAGLQLGEQDLLRQQVLDVALDAPDAADGRPAPGRSHAWRSGSLPRA